MSLTGAFEEVIEFIAAGTSPDNVAAFRLSDAARQRAAELVEQEKTTGLTAEERSELEHYLQLEHIMRLAKARAPAPLRSVDEWALSSKYISAELRRLIIARADSLCEYCLIHEDDTFFGCEVDHISVQP